MHFWSSSPYLLLKHLLKSPPKSLLNPQILLLSDKNWKEIYAGIFGL